MPATLGDTVHVHYTGRLVDGNEFDSSRGREPLAFTLGDHHVIAGFEDGVLGMEPGETKTITIPVDQAYGPRRDEMIATFPRAQFGDEVELHIGDQLHLRLEDGQLLPVVIADLTQDFVTLDGNHMLAGQDLVFDLELVRIGA